MGFGFRLTAGIALRRKGASLAACFIEFGFRLSAYDRLTAVKRKPGGLLYRGSGFA